MNRDVYGVATGELAQLVSAVEAHQRGHDASNFPLMWWFFGHDPFLSERPLRLVRRGLKMAVGQQLGTAVIVGLPDDLASRKKFVSVAWPIIGREARVRGTAVRFSRSPQGGWEVSNVAPLGRRGRDALYFY
jgi:hypothetical protein